MTRKNLTLLGLLIATLLFAVSCKDKKSDPIPFNQKFEPYIYAYSTGVISTRSEVYIQFRKEMNLQAEPNTELDRGLFDVEPDVDGKVVMKDKNTIVFIPEEPLESDQSYEFKFDMTKVYDMPEDLEVFHFGIHTIKQSFSVYNNGLISFGTKAPEYYSLTGEVILADIAESEDVASLLEANMNTSNFDIRWDSISIGKRFTYRIDSIKRTKKAQHLLIEWSGESLGIENNEGTDTLEVPSTDNFKILEVDIRQQPEQHLIIRFSDPLNAQQDLSGLIRLDKGISTRYSVQDNVVKVYPKIRQSGQVSLAVYKSIQNVFRNTLKESYSSSFTFDDIKPEVRLIGSGHILPNSKGLIVPFEAVNLRAVDVKIVKIFESNIPQFLQYNDLDESDNIKRVGRPILFKRISLEKGKPLNMSDWNTFSIDLTKLIKQELGAIYEMTLSFRQEYSNYSCSGIRKQKTEILEDKDLIGEVNMSKWDYEDNNYYYDYDYDYNYDSYYPDGYEWQQKDNPCHISYYSKRRHVSRNILASNLGLIVKSSDKNEVTAFVTDILTTKPKSGVKVRILDYQLQDLGSATTDSDGKIFIKSERKPFLLIAESGKDRAYLKLNSAASNSTSVFDVDGEEVQDGLKGFFYGERGVWRPGDTLFLSFILEDEDKHIPLGHPIQFTLRNPKGQVSKKITAHKNSSGFYSFQCITNPSDPTGYWRAKVEIGGATFSKGIRIETVKPNRLKIVLDFEDEILSVDSDKPAKLHVKWLHGAKAPKLKADVNLHLSSSSTQFKGYKDYVFTDRNNHFSAEDNMIYEGSVDENGDANIPIDIQLSSTAPGMLSASFIIKAYEGGGDFSTHYLTKQYSPYEHYVGLKIPKNDNYGSLNTDKKYQGKLVVVDKNGKPQKNTKVEVRMFKLEWRWWWNVSNENLASYISRNYQNLQFEKSIKTNSKGEAKFEMGIKYPNWGRYLVQVKAPSGHVVTKIIYFDWPEWRGRSKRDRSDGASILSFTSDKTDYKVGETAVINFPSSGIGRALISIENGSEVINALWVEPEKGEKETKVKIPISSDMAPNCFVHITLVQPHAQTANDLPIRLYGVIPLMVVDPNTKLKPVLKMPKVLAPEKTFKVNVSEKNNRPMTYTIAIVDEGLLDLTSFRTPSPWDAFYAREALGIRTWDIYDDVLGAYGGKMEKNFAIGGDADINKKGGKKAQRFKPVVIFKGPFILEKGTATHTFKMPNYVGSVRTMVIAGDGTAYGNAEATAPVKSPVMVLPTVPRVVGPGETITLPVTVFVDKSVKNVKVSISSNKLLTVVGSKTKSLSFKKAGDKMVFFQLKAAENTGIAKIKVLANGGAHSMHYDVELDVRAANPSITKHIDKVLKKDQKLELPYKSHGITGSNEAYMEVSFIPPIDFKRRLKYLIRYPYGCSEQITSSAFPQLFVKSVMKVDDAFAAQMEQNVKGGIQQLSQRQLDNGGFQYWPGATQASDWVTSYVGHFLIKAKAMGYYVSNDVLSDWKYYQRKEARDWRIQTSYSWSKVSSVRLQAYRLYTLALYGTPQISEMNRLREYAKMDASSRYLLSAAYAKAGKEEAAASLIQDSKMSWQTYNYQDYSTYGSALRDKAIVLLAANELQDFELSAALVKDIAKAMNEQNWMSTQTTAFCLLAISEFSNVSDFSTRMMKFKYKNDSEDWKSFSSVHSFAQIPVHHKPKTAHKIAIENTSGALLYFRLVSEGIPVAGNEEAESSHMGIKVRYKDMKGNILDVSKLPQGTNFVAEVSVTNPRSKYLYNLALTEIFPSGWEVINTRLAGYQMAGQVGVANYMDIRDDRIHYHFHMSKETKTFKVQLNAAYAGKYYLPAVNCEAMYDNTIYARTKGQWIEIVKE